MSVFVVGHEVIPTVAAFPHGSHACAAYKGLASTVVVRAEKFLNNANANRRAKHPKPTRVLLVAAVLSNHDVKEMEYFFSILADYHEQECFTQARNIR